MQGAWWRYSSSLLLQELLPTSLGHLCMRGFLWAPWCVLSWPSLYGILETVYTQCSCAGDAAACSAIELNTTET